MILKSNNFGPKKEIYHDLRQVEKQKFLKLNFECDSYEVPKLPDWTNKTFHIREAQVNPYHLICSCEDYAHTMRIYPDRDIRRTCRHIYWILMRDNLAEFIDPLTQLLLNSHNKYGKECLYKLDNDILLGFREGIFWVNVYTLNNEEGRWKRYSYEFEENRWSYGNLPFEANKIEKKIKNIISGGDKTTRNGEG